MTKRILLISETTLFVDGRALRFAATLQQAGYSVVGAGFHGPDGETHRCPGFEKLILVSRPRPNRLSRYWLPLTFSIGALARPLYRLSYWLFPHRHRLMRRILDELGRSGDRPELVIAKHWSAGPLGLAVAERFGAKLIYDANELSFAEHEHNWKWRLVARPVVRRLDRLMFRRADLVTTIGRGLSDAFTREYRLASPPTVIRNIPNSTALPPRPPGQMLRFIYIGLAHRVRHLEDIIESVVDWSPDRMLVLQLTGDAAYIESLKKLARTRGFEKQIEFRNPVHDRDIVASLDRADVGLCLFKTFSRQLQLAEPNKFYQYLLGGLPVLASQLPRMSEIITAYGCGWSLPGQHPQEIAHAVNGISTDQLVRAQEGVVRVQADISWEKEGETLTSAIRSLEG